MKTMLILNSLLLGWYAYDLLKCLPKNKQNVIVAIAGIVVSLLLIWSWY